jgi:hypothetical protein
MLHDWGLRRKHLMVRNLYLIIFLFAGLPLIYFFVQQASGTPTTGISNLSASSLSLATSLSSTSTSQSSYEIFDGTELGISFQYPSNWVKFEAGFDRNDLNDFEGVVSFDILNDSTNQANDKQFEDSGIAHPNLSIVSLKSPYHNLSLGQYAEVRTFDIRQLFSDYRLRITEDRQSNETIDGYPYWVLEYSFTVDDRTQRYGMSIMLMRGEKVYEISYIADGYEGYVKNMEEIMKLIKTAYFVDSSNHR